MRSLLDTETFLDFKKFAKRRKATQSTAIYQLIRDAIKAENEKAS